MRKTFLVRHGRSKQNEYFDLIGKDLLDLTPDDIAQIETSGSHSSIEFPDNGLAEIGFSQSSQVANVLKTEIDENAIFVVSPLKRAIQTIAPTLKQILDFDITLLLDQDYLIEIEKLRRLGYNDLADRVDYDVLLHPHEKVFVDPNLLESFWNQKNHDLNHAKTSRLTSRYLETRSETVVFCGHNQILSYFYGIIKPDETLARIENGQIIKIELK